MLAPGGMSLSPSSLSLQLLERSISSLLMSAASTDGVSMGGVGVQLESVLCSWTCVQLPLRKIPLLCMFINNRSYYKNTGRLY